MANRASRHSMTKWHPRKSDGKAVRCEADVRKCPRTKEGEVHVYANTPGEAQRKIDTIKAEYAGDGFFATASTSNPSTTVTPPNTNSGDTKPPAPTPGGAAPSGRDNTPPPEDDNDTQARKAWEQMSLVEQGRECERILNEAIQNRQPIGGLDLSLRHQYAERALSQAIRDGKITSKIYASSEVPGMEYTKERHLAQQEIIEDVLKAHDKVPREGKAVLSGGMGGAGKTTVLTRYLGMDTSQYITINPDDIKEIMAERGMIPTLRGLTPMECSTLAHQEASYISSLIMKRAIAEKRNIILDGTMASMKSMRRRTGQLRDGGYHMSAVFVDITPETSQKRATSRYQRGMSKYTTSREGHGGRILPASVNQGNTPEDPTRFRSRSAENLAALYEDGTIPSTPVVYNNDGDAPQPVAYDDFVGRVEYE